MVIYKRGKAIALGLSACAIAAAAAVGTLAGAGFTVGTADALHPAPLFLSDVVNCEAHNQGDKRNYDDVIHKTAPFGKLLLQSILVSQAPVGLFDQTGNDKANCNHNCQTDQSGDNIQEIGSGDQGTDGVNQVIDRITGGERQSHTAPEPLAVAHLGVHGAQSSEAGGWRRRKDSSIRFVNFL